MAELVGSRITSRAGPRADSRVPKGRPAAELRRRRGSGRAGSGGSLSGGSSPRPPASFRLWRSHDLIGVDEHPASWRAAFRVIFAGTPPVTWSGRPQTTTAMAGTSPADWRGTASMALFWLRPGRQVRPGSFWAELPCPLKAATVSAAGALDDVQAGRDVARPRGRVVSDAQQHPGVAGQEAPVRHHNNRPFFPEIRLLVFDCECSLRGGTGISRPRRPRCPGVTGGSRPWSPVALSGGNCNCRTRVPRARDPGPGPADERATRGPGPPPDTSTPDLAHLGGTTELGRLKPPAPNQQGSVLTPPLSGRPARSRRVNKPGSMRHRGAGEI